MQDKTKKCKVPNCDKKYYSSDFCRHHFYMNRKAIKKGHCKIDQCCYPVYNQWGEHQLCRTHFYELVRDGAVSTLPKCPGTRRTPCVANGYIDGYCAACYKRKQHNERQRQKALLRDADNFIWLTTTAANISVTGEEGGPPDESTPCDVSLTTAVVEESNFVTC